MKPIELELLEEKIRDIAEENQKIKERISSRGDILEAQWRLVELLNENNRLKQQLGGDGAS